MASPSLCEAELSPGQLCPEAATESIRIRDEVTRFTTVVRVCDEHAAEHKRRAATTRRAIKSRTKK